MAAEKGLKVDISKMRLMCTLDCNRQGPDLKEIYSSRFCLGNITWKLAYSKVSDDHVLWLCRFSGSGGRRRVVRVSVVVEGHRNGRIVDALSMSNRFSESETNSNPERIIWMRKEQDIVRAVPEFRPRGVLKLIVILKRDSYWTASLTRSVTVRYRSTSVQTTPFIDVPPCLQSLSKDLAQLMVDDSHHDVEFQCAGHSTKAHKSIVCKRSPVIAAMLATDMVEGRTGVVKISDMQPDIFTQFMRYIYCGQLEELTFDTALKLYQAGDQYQILGLSRRCFEFLVGNLSVDNAYEVLVVADAHNDKESVEKVIDYMIESHVPLVSKEWSAFCDEHSNLAFRVLNRAYAKNAVCPAIPNPRSVRILD